MFRLIAIGFALALAACAPETEIVQPETERVEWRLVIHGGAGVILRQDLSAEQEAAYRAALETALEAGAEVLRERWQRGGCGTSGGAANGE